MANNPSGVMNDVFKLMSESRYRIVLEYLRHRIDDPVSYEALIQHVVDTETDAWGGAVPPEYPNYVAGDIKHAVIPQLAQLGIIERDSSTGTIWYRGNAIIDSALRLAAPTLSA